MTFIDVGQGDSILIELPFHQGKILVDSYNNIDYLKSRGISSLDYVIITHFDQDHMGSLLELSKSFKIKKLFYSSYEDVKKISHINAPKVAICGVRVLEFEHAFNLSTTSFVSSSLIFSMLSSTPKFR